MDVLIESVNKDAGAELMKWLTTSQSSPQVIGTVISRKALGRRIYFDEHGQLQHAIGGDGVLSSNIASQAVSVLSQRRSMLARDSTDHGVLDLFLEYLEPPLKLVIFGAGNDVVPLASFAKTLGWRVTLVDVRSASVDVGRTWDVDTLVRCQVDEIADKVMTTESTAAIVMTHNFSHDRQIVRWLIGQPLSYLGVLGARHRTSQLLSELEADPAMLHSPVGLDLGGEAPEEVALAIVAEITAVMHGRSGSPLRHRPGPIHAPAKKLENAPWPVAAS